MKKKRRKFTDEFKDEAVKLVLEQRYGISEAAKNLGIHANLLGRWKREHEDSGKCRSDTRSTVAIKEELNRLRKENKCLKMEREIRKKGGHLLRERIGLRYQFIDTQKRAYKVALLYINQLPQR